MHCGSSWATILRGGPLAIPLPLLLPPHMRLPRPSVPLPPSLLLHSSEVVRLAQGLRNMHRSKMRTIPHSSSSAHTSQLLILYSGVVA